MRFLSQLVTLLWSTSGQAVPSSLVFSLKCNPEVSQVKNTHIHRGVLRPDGCEGMQVWENVITFASCPLASRFIVEVDITVSQVTAQMKVVLQTEQESKSLRMLKAHKSAFISNITMRWVFLQSREPPVSEIYSFWIPITLNRVVCR